MASTGMLSVEIKDMFFDRQKIIDELSEDNRRKLSKTGAFVRTRARSKLRRRKKVSGAGQAPSVHSRDSRATLKYILFGLSEDKQSVAIGPVGLPSLQLADSSATTIPELLEQGGTSVVNGKRARYAARPFMGPSLEEEVNSGSIADLWGS